MRVYMLKREQHLNISLDHAWAFFSSAENLQAITPSYMNFTITNSPGELIYGGQLITYKVSPLLSIPLTWVTEITQVVDHSYFIDEQRFGPFKLWHHQHHFTETDKGVKMTDIVHYSLPFSFIGRLAHSITIKSRLEEIFEYRYKTLEETFNG
ncbi:MULTISPECIES: SRPBCC family protein [Shouchella]|uniref:SRPBCC family protein n=1 Tax=Shouchella hunanensis TaxID=766894 RepID=A0ABY7W915_9BACI|nr:MULTISPECIES: SRPBCC family protein [Shouchella]WDF05423.1 SRPBCC family protein [Shouchella hunanensis]GAF22553.1 cell division inhibitor [Bacillus sp. JCM 19047]